MPVSTINGVNINWRVVGDRGRDNHPWVVMTTGGRRGHDEFIPLAEKIAAYGYRVMLHDRRNTGASDILIDGDEGEEIIWTRDMHALLSEQNVLPAFFSGSSAGARTSILFYLNYPQAVRGLLLLRVTGGAFAAGRLPENYYGQFIRAAKEGGMAAVCAMEAWQERIAANPRNGEYLAKLPAQTIHRRADALERHFRRRRAISGDGREPGAIARDQDADHRHSRQRQDPCQHQRAYRAPARSPAANCTSCRSPIRTCRLFRSRTGASTSRRSRGCSPTS